MTKQWFAVTLTVVACCFTGPALPRPHLETAPPAVAAPGGLLGVLGGESAAQRPACPIIPCIHGDQACLQSAFASLRACVTAGIAPELDAAPGVSVFRAHGAYYTVYGTLAAGAAGSTNRALLHGYRATLEALDETLP